MYPKKLKGFLCLSFRIYESVCSDTFNRHGFIPMAVFICKYCINRNKIYYSKCAKECKHSFISGRLDHYP